MSQEHYDYRQGDQRYYQTDGGIEPMGESVDHQSAMELLVASVLGVIIGFGAVAIFIFGR